VSISGYHIREAGATAAQELAFTLADGMCYAEESRARGLAVDAFAKRLSFFFDVHNDFFEEVAKFRAARRIWARIMREKYKAQDERNWWMRCHAQTAGVSLTEQQPMNNVVRVAFQGLAAVLGGTQSLHTNSMDETLALPTEHAAKVALRTQQIIADETNVTQYADPLGGSYLVEKLTNEIEAKATAIFDQIDAMGGVIPAIERGYFRRAIAESALEQSRRFERGETITVGVNKYHDEEDAPIPTLVIDKEVERTHVARLTELRRKREKARHEEALKRLRQDAAAGANVMPALVEASEADATVGEMMRTLQSVYGTYDGTPEW
jgi:methylmalonyl-CoA mutase N-terminal domain/subunit